MGNAGNTQAGIIGPNSPPKVINIPRGMRLEATTANTTGIMTVKVTAQTVSGQSLTWYMLQPKELSLSGDVFSTVTFTVDTSPGTGLIWCLSPEGSPQRLGSASFQIVTFAENTQPVSVSNFPSGFDVNNFPPKVPYAGTGAAPITGTWRGYAVARAAGEVSIEISGVTVTLGSATVAGQSFAFTLGIGATVTPALTNCSIGGGILEP